MYSFKNNVLSTLLCHNAGSLQNIFEIPVGCAVLLVRGRSFSRDLDNVHVRPLYLDTGDGVKARVGIDQPLHEAEVAAGYSFCKSHPYY